MFDVEVGVAPCLVTRIDIGPKRRTGLLGDTVPMHTVFFYPVIRRQVETAAEPPDRLFAFFFGDEKTHVGV